MPGSTARSPGRRRPLDHRHNHLPLAANTPEATPMGSIHRPRFASGDRVLHNNRPASVLRNGSPEGTVVLLFDGLDDEHHCHEKFLVSAAHADAVPLAEQPAKALTTERLLGIYDQLLKGFHDTEH